MESQILVGQQKIRFDREVTLRLYCELIKIGGADGCSCTSCRNFAAQRSRAYPKEFLRLLNELGADPLKEWEAFDYDFEPSPQHHLYGGWFLFSGEIIEGGANRAESKPFSHWFTISFPNATFPQDMQDIKICAVEFCAEIPWNPPKN
jgi:hypothetical protein